MILTEIIKRFLLDSHSNQSFCDKNSYQTSDSLYLNYAHVNKENLMQVQKKKKQSSRIRTKGPYKYRLALILPIFGPLPSS